MYARKPTLKLMLLLCVLCGLYSTFTVIWEGGRGGQREDRGVTVHKCSSFVHGGQQFTSWAENTNHEWLYLQSIKSVKHNAAKSVNRSILKKSRHIGYGVFIVHSSMAYPVTHVIIFLRMFFKNYHGYARWISWRYVNDNVVNLLILHVISVFIKKCSYT
jgi:hypothetical protein